MTPATVVRSRIALKNRVKPLDHTPKRAEMDERVERMLKSGTGPSSRHV